MINARLTEDRVTATKIKRTKGFSDLVVNTWEQVLKKSGDIPNNGLHNNVGMGCAFPAKDITCPESHPRDVKKNIPVTRTGVDTLRYMGSALLTFDSQKAMCSLCGCKLFSLEIVD